LLDSPPDSESGIGSVLSFFPILGSCGDSTDSHLEKTQENEVLGYSPEALTQIVLERKTAASVDAVDRKEQRPVGRPPKSAEEIDTLNRTGQPSPEIDNNIINKRSAQGTSQAQALRRLRKDRPDLHAKVLSGEIKSANKAMVVAGFISAANNCAGAGPRTNPDAQRWHSFRFI
jgi:hypothetical protein